MRAPFHLSLLAVLAMFTIGSKSTLVSIDDELSIILEKSLQDDTEVFTRAVEIIHSLETSPSCNRLATRALLNSCQSLETSNEDTSSEAALDDAKSIYAARLAVCELVGATATVPHECQTFIPSRSCNKTRLWTWRLLTSQTQTQTRNLCYPEFSQQTLNKCLRKMASLPQWWTSYSNARQNGVVMCHASRSAVEKEHLLEVYRAAASTSADISAALTHTVKRAREQLQAMDSFLASVNTLNIQTLNDLKDTRIKVSGALSSLLAEFHDGLKSVWESAVQATAKATTEVEFLQMEIGQTKASVQEIYNKTLNFWKTHHGQWQSTIERSYEVERVLKSSSEAMKKESNNVIDDMRATADLIRMIMETQAAYHKAFQEDHFRIAEAQEKFESAINRQQAVVEDTTHKISEMYPIRVFSSLSRYIGLSVIIILVYKFACTGIAFCVAAFTGVTIGLFESTVLEDFLVSFTIPSAHLSISQVFWLPFHFAAGTFISLAALFGVYRWFRRSILKETEEGVLLNVEARG